jgi:hypothetical protein
VLRPGAAHGSLPRQTGAGETIVVTDHTMLHTGHVLPLSCTRPGYLRDWDGTGMCASVKRQCPSLTNCKKDPHNVYAIVAAMFRQSHAHQAPD